MPVWLWFIGQKYGFFGIVSMKINIYSTSVEICQYVRFAALCFCLVTVDLIHIFHGCFSGSRTIARVSVKQAWMIWVNKSHASTGNTNMATTKQSTTQFMMTSSNGNIFRVTDHLCGEFTGPGQFPTQRPVTRSFDVYFDLRPNKWLSKQSWGWWFETLSCSLWRHRNVCAYFMGWTVYLYAYIDAHTCNLYLYPHSGIRNHLFEEIYSTCNWQKDAYSFYCTYCTYWNGLLVEKIRISFHIEIYIDACSYTVHPIEIHAFSLALFCGGYKIFHFWFCMVQWNLSITTT